MRRGDIVTVAGGVYASKPRPALIVQDDRFDATDSVTVCPFTSTEVDAPLLRVPVTADEENGLDQDSFLMVDKITTVRRSNARAVVGRLEATTLVEFERRLLAAKSKISALEDGDLRPDQVAIIAKRLGVTAQDVIDMNRRLGGDASLNAPIRDDGDPGEWQDWLVDTSPNAEAMLAESEEFDHRHDALVSAMKVSECAREAHLRGAASG